MSRDIDETGLLLGRIPSRLLTPQQIPCWKLDDPFNDDHENEDDYNDDSDDAPTYQLLRKPVSLKEFHDHGKGVVIWRNNDTLTYVTTNGGNDAPCDPRRALSMKFVDDGLSLYITGNTDEAVADTVAYFLSCDSKESCIKVSTRNPHRYSLEPTVVRSQCLQRILEATNRVILTEMTLSVEQSIILATQPQPLHLTLDRCSFEDEGTAFMDALESRSTVFGSLSLEYSSFSDDSWKRLVQISKIGHLKSSEMINEGLDLLPFSAKADSLEYEIQGKALSYHRK
ncbi:hypothetical protein FisN_26Hu148 [Fistulifera solaris]|uniref:Uncharacterized protein n=1 Tax=Fistulifera solaris TaxID=1519565 RepID=A0A1Z5JY82_FISSO|nr:hypothetical protein FisN_26Hu148 [Fistulifera solaris]|eukprot:GAX18846.1 hypothetical protein FisN_26Hu148 [Fistulifera solaris]